MLQYYKYAFWEGFPLDEFEKDLNETQDLPVESAETPQEDAADAIVASEDAALAPEAAEAADETAAEESADAEPSTPTGEDALVQELEGIRDLLQQELDNAQSGELIQELDDVPDTEEAGEEPEEIPEEERCTCCGERRRDTSFGEDYPYCTECRDLMKAAPIKWSRVLCWLVMVGVAFGALILTGNTISDYATLMEAETYYANHCIIDAEATYYNYVSQASYSENYSRSAVKNLIKIFSNMGYIGDANDLVTQYFTENQLKLPWNKRFATVAAEYKELSEASNKVSELLQDVMYDEDGFDFDEKNAALEKLAEPAEDGTPGLSELFVEYYRYVLMNLSKKKTDAEMLEQLQHLESLDNGTHVWLYLTNLLSLVSKTGDVELTQHYFDKCMEINIQEASAYTALANAYRFSGEVDPEKLMEIADDAEENMSSSAVPTYHLIRALAYLFKEDAKSATEQMDAYINSGAATGQTPYTVQSCNLYALCCVMTGDDDGYKQMEDVFASADLEISPLVTKYRKGKLTLNEVLTDNGGDI